VPASVYAEVLVHAAAAGRDEEIDHFLYASGTEIAPFDRATARIAADLRKRHRSLSPEDAWVLATAHERHARLLTFDNRLNRLT
jgi:predicted nucleic acid-binding protein